jgi:hypothetical protein
MYIQKLSMPTLTLGLLLGLGSCMGQVVKSSHGGGTVVAASNRSLAEIEDDLFSATSNVGCGDVSDCTYVHYERGGCALANKEIIYSKSADVSQVSALAAEYDQVYSKSHEGENGICLSRDAPPLACVSISGGGGQCEHQ